MFSEKRNYNSHIKTHERTVQETRETDLVVLDKVVYLHILNYLAEDYTTGVCGDPDEMLMEELKE